MWIRVFLRREGEVEGSWMPTLIGSECWVASDWRPRTNGEVLAGWQRERDSVGDEEM